MQLRAAAAKSGRKISDMDTPSSTCQRVAVARWWVFVVLGLYRVVDDCKLWRPAVAVIDSLGEMLPMLGASSNSPDDYTTANRQVLQPFAATGAAVIAIDHLAQNAITCNRWRRRTRPARCGGVRGRRGRAC